MINEQHGLYEEILSRYVYTDCFSTEEQEKARAGLDKLIKMYGSPVSSYPSWHPLMKATRDPKSLRRIFGKDHTSFTCAGEAYEEGHQILDHAFYLQHAIIACPYGNEKNEAFSKINFLNEMIHTASVTAYEASDFKLYNEYTTTVVLSLNLYDLDSNGGFKVKNYDEYANDVVDNNLFIPKEHAVPLMLKNELECYGYGGITESWKTMKDLILGTPNNNKSSAFVDGGTFNALKDAWGVFEKHELYGPLYKRVS